MSSGGQVRHRSDGRWEGRYLAADGRRRSLYAPTKREAQEKVRRALLEADAGIRPVESRTTVAAYLEEWLTTSVAVRCRPRTVESYRETVARYIAPRFPKGHVHEGQLHPLPALGRLALAKLEPEHVGRMLAALTARGDLSPTTVRYVYAVLRIALGRALKQGRVIRNVATLVDPPAKAAREIHPLTAAEARELVAGTAGDRLGPLFATAIATGMRQGELLALRWRDVDLDAGAIAVRHTLQRRSRSLAAPKTDRGRRVVRLGPGSAELLREHRRRQSTIDPDAYVFATSDGKPLDGTHVTRDLKLALARLKLPQQRFHDLRHAYATLLIEDGEELAVVSRMLGHADLSTTADVYAHLTPGMGARAAARIDAILARDAASS